MSPPGGLPVVVVKFGRTGLFPFSKQAKSPANHVALLSANWNGFRLASNFASWPWFSDFLFFINVILQPSRRNLSRSFLLFIFVSRSPFGFCTTCVARCWSLIPLFMKAISKPWSLREFSLRYPSFNFLFLWKPHRDCVIWVLFKI